MELTENASTSIDSEQNSATTTEDQMKYDEGHPFILEVKYDDGTQKEYKLMMINEDDQHKPRLYMNVAIVGTARAKRGWPPKEIKCIVDDHFNTLYWQNDKDNYTIMRWVDINISSFHSPYNVIKSIQ